MGPPSPFASQRRQDRGGGSRPGGGPGGGPVGSPGGSPGAGADAAEALVKRSVERDWGLYQLKPAQTSLEDVFVNLTRREETP